MKQAIDWLIIQILQEAEVEMYDNWDSSASDMNKLEAILKDHLRSLTEPTADIEACRHTKDWELFYYDSADWRHCGKCWEKISMIDHLTPAPCQPEGMVEYRLNWKQVSREEFVNCEQPSNEDWRPTKQEVKEAIEYLKAKNLPPTQLKEEVEKVEMTEKDKTVDCKYHLTENPEYKCRKCGWEPIKYLSDYCHHCGIELDWTD